LSSTDAAVSFATISNKHYRLERSDEVTGPWRLAVDNVVGTGGLVQVVDIGGAGRARRFYRVRSLNVSLLVVEGTTTNFTVRLAVPPTNNVVVAISRTSGSTNLNVSSGQTLTFTPGNWDLPQTVTIGASEEGSTADDLAIFTVSSAGLASRIVNAVGLDNDLQSVTNCLGGNAIFGAAPFGNGPFTYSWRKDSETLSGEINSSLVLTNLASGDSGVYSVQIDGPSYTLMKSGTLVVNTPLTATALGSLASCPGTQATFSTLASGSPPFTYQWRKGGNTLSGQTNSSLTLNNVSAADAASYCVVVSGVCNSVTN
jgi:hypothetical protein